MKKIAMLLAVLFCFFAGAVWADDYPPLMEDKYDNVITSENLNEWWNLIAKNITGVTADDLVGTWNCEAITRRQPGADDIQPSWVIDSDSLYHKLTGATITFTNDGDDTYSLTTSDPNPFNAHRVCHWEAEEDPVLVCDGPSSSYESNYKVDNNVLALKDRKFYNIRYINSNKIELVNISVGGEWDAVKITMVKPNPPPETPTNLVVIKESSKPKLEWTDITGESGYYIYRRDLDVENPFVIVETNDPDDVDFKDDSLSAGTYWYYVKSFIDYGGGIIVESLYKSETKIVTVE